MIKKSISILASFWLIYMGYGLLISQFEIQIFEKSIPGSKPNPRAYYDYKGVTHISSLKSKGSGSIEYIAQSAKSAGLDFIIITDTNDFDNDTDQAQLYDELLVINGGKFSYVDSNLLIYGGLNIHQFKSPGQAQVLLNDLLTQTHRSPENMSIFLAHPTKKRYEWIGEFPVGIDGVEVINLKELWAYKAENEKFDFLWSLLLYPFNEKLTYFRIIHNPEDTLELWDKLNLTQRTLGILGNHTTAKAMFLPTKNGYLEFPTYETSFKIASNHILLKSELTGDKTRDFNKILEAIHKGNFYFSYDILGDPKGVSFEAVSKKTYFLPGDEIVFSEGQEIQVRLPQKMLVPFEVQLFKDGKLYTTSNQEIARFKINEAGVYRILIAIKPKMPFLQKARWVPWIYANPFYFK